MTTMTKGFSLLELVAVLAIFALVSLIGVQVIDASVRSQTRMSQTHDAVADLSFALALLRRDMNAATALPFQTSEGPVPPIQINATGFTLTVSGMGLDPETSEIAQVRWQRTSDGTLTRQVVTAAAAAPERVILAGIDGFAISAYDAQAGWRPGFRSTEATPLPRGLRVRFDHTTAKGIEIVARVQ